MSEVKMLALSAKARGDMSLAGESSGDDVHNRIFCREDVVEL